MNRNEAIANSFKRRHTGRGIFSDAQIKETCKAIAASTNEQVDAKCNVISALFYFNVMINVYDSTHTKFVMKFNGNAGGLGIPGDSLFEVSTVTPCEGYTIQNIYDNTKSFECTSMSIAVSIIFFDGSSHAIGHLEGAGAGSVIGEFGGTGHWSTF